LVEWEAKQAVAMKCKDAPLMNGEWGKGWKQLYGGGWADAPSVKEAQRVGCSGNRGEIDAYLGTSKQFV
jgi:hypothetical protein